MCVLRAEPSKLAAHTAGLTFDSIYNQEIMSRSVPHPGRTEFYIDGSR